MEFGLFYGVPAVLFILLSVFVTALSWRSLHYVGSHGFYRFFAFQGILLLLLINIPFWFKNPFSPLQLLSWILLLFSILFVVQGLYSLKKYGGYADRGAEAANFSFENTATLVTDGIYKQIRHPMYSSLLLLTWGALLKHITILAVITAVFATAFLVATAKKEEQENIAFFGARYQQYMKKTKMFLPYFYYSPTNA